MKTKKKKKQEQVLRPEELNFFRKKGEEQKNDNVFTVSCKVNTNQEKDERIAVLATNLSLLALRLGGGGRAGSLPPFLMLRLVVYTQNFDQYVQ